MCFGNYDFLPLRPLTGVMVRQEMALDRLGWRDRCLDHLLTDGILRGGLDYQFQITACDYLIGWLWPLRDKADIAVSSADVSIGTKPASLTRSTSAKNP
jgi:hypothetical protein